MPIDLSIISVTWRSKDDVLRLIESIRQNVTDMEYEIFVVDNNGGDDTPQAVRAAYPEVHVIANNTNLGYAGGMNQGYKLAQGKYVVFMNPDMIVLEDTFRKLKERLDQDEKIGLIAPQLLYEDRSIQPTVKNDPNLWSQILITLKLHHFIRSRSLDRYLAKDFDYTREAHVDQLMGAFLMGRKDAIDSWGAWDEDYPLWWEDLQMCKDSRRAGYYNLYYPYTHVIHFEGKSFAQVLNMTKQKRFNFGMRQYFKKNHGYVSYLILLALYPISMALAWLTQILKVKPRTQSKI